MEMQWLPGTRTAGYLTARFFDGYTPRPREVGGRREDIRVEDAIIERVIEKPQVSTREIAAEIGVSKSMVHRTLKKEGLHPFHYTKVQGLDENDPVRRLEFCRCRVVSGGRVLRRGMDYRLGLQLCGETGVRLRAAVIHSGREVVAEERTDLPPGFHLLPIRIPANIRKGNYSVVVEGREISSHSQFKDTFPIHFAEKFLSLIIQTSRPIFTSSQTVRFRILALDSNLQPYDDALEVYIVDPDDFIMRRWLSVYTNNGIASLKYKLPNLAKEGYWKIRIKANDQVEELKIKVENYFATLFEVFVEIPPYILDTEENIIAKIYGKFTSEEIVQGNATIRAFYSSLKEPSADEALFFEEKTFLKRKSSKVVIPMNLLREPVGSEVRVTVSLKDFLTGETVTGFSRTRIVQSSVQARFLTDQPAYFKPSMPSHLYVAVQYSDNVGLSSEVLEKSTIQLEVTYHLRGGGGSISVPLHFSAGLDLVRLERTWFGLDSVLLDPRSESEYTNSGVLGFSVIPPEETEKVTLSARYSDAEGNSADAKLTLHLYPSNSGKYLAVWTSTRDALVQEYAVFHVKTNFFTPRFQYLVVSKGCIVGGGEVPAGGGEGGGSTTTTFPLALSSEMAPGFRVLVFTRHRETPTSSSSSSAELLLADSLYLPLSAFNRYEMELTLNRGKDFKGDLVEMIVSGDVGAYICAHSVRSSVYQIQADNDITQTRLTESLIALEDFTKPVNKVFSRDREGGSPVESRYYLTHDYGKDANSTFHLSGLFLSTHALTNHSQGLCSEDEIPCFETGCYPVEARCDGLPHCSDLSDELNCEALLFEEDLDYKIHRTSRSTYLYDAEFGDWGWREIKKNDHEGIEFEPLDAPNLDENWYFTAFSVSPKYGFSIISEPVIYSTKRPFSAHVSGPPACKRGEQVSLRVILKNNEDHQALVTLQLMSSPDYKFVHVEEGGLVSSYSARLSPGHHQLLVYIPPESQKHIDYPVKPVIEQGDVEVNLIASTLSGRVVLTHKITVKPEGAMIKRHTPVMLDLKNRAFVLNYLNVIVEETPIVPYQEWRRYIYGSPKASFTLNGDVIGPVFTQIPMTIETILERHGKGTDSRILEFTVNIMNLRYLRVTNKITPSILRETLEETNTIYAHVMKRYDAEGWLSNSDLKQPSVWLTAWALRAFRSAMYADWENTLYIDLRIFQKSVNWILNYQNDDGSFSETEHFYSSLESKWRDNRTLTSHVLLGLSSCVELLEGEVRSGAVRGLMRGSRYLESSLSRSVSRLSLQALALHVTQSTARDEAYFKLMKLVLESGETAYWSEEKLPPPPVSEQNQRPFLGPRPYTDGLTAAVETTAIALLLHLTREGVTPLADRIVRTLSTLRMSNSGFVSITDTCWALEALTEYANHARVLELTNIDVTINSAIDPTFKHKIHISNTSLYDDVIPLSRVWGHLSAVARGTGLALLQLDLSYGVDWEPLIDRSNVDSFQLTVREMYSSERNKSSITIQTCMSWLRDYPSGRAVLEMEIPTGYMLVESEATQYMTDMPLLTDARTLPGLTMWYFDHIPREQTCFNHSVRRWHPVANISLTRQALLYEVNARENFVQVLVNSTPLYILNICEVCGSYQCPYCPFYNSSYQIKVSRSIIMLLFILSLWKI